MQLLIEVFFVLAVVISSIYAFIRNTTTTVVQGVKEKMREREIKNGINHNVSPTVRQQYNSVNASKLGGKPHSLINTHVTNELYQLIDGISYTLVESAPVNIRKKSMLEANMLLFTVCQLVIKKDECWQKSIVPLLDEFFDRVRIDGYYWNIHMVTARMDMYRDELIKTFNGEGNYYGGIITFLLFEKPLSISAERSSDLGKSMEIIGGIRISIDVLTEFFEGYCSE